MDGEKAISMASGIVKIFILAENRLLREALSRILNKKSDIQVVGASAIHSSIVDDIIGCAAEVLLLDCAVLALSKLRLVPEVRAALPGVKVVMVGMDPDKEVFLQAVRDGIMGFVLKEASAAEVATAVRAVASEEAVCPPCLTRSLFEQLSQQSSSGYFSSLVVRSDLGLTRREQQLVQMISTGLTNKQIAVHFGVSEQTVKNQVHRMLRKLGANNRLAAVEACRSSQIVA
jgi:DNA-binding NarL/FixJ family response regulator